MKKLLAAIAACSVLLTSCTPEQEKTVARCERATVLLHIKLAKGKARGMGVCSGVYVAKNLILTADHCVDPSVLKDESISIKDIWVRNFAGRSAKATVVKVSKEKDLALLKTDLKGHPVSFAWDVTVGQDCYVVGNPLSLEWVVSKGIVSQKNFTFEDEHTVHFITDAAVLPGNSGGPCFDSHGHLLGIVVRSTSLFGIFGSSGLGFVVQINEIRDFLNHK